MSIPLKEHNVLNILSVHNYIMAFLILVSILVIILIIFIIETQSYNNIERKMYCYFILARFYINKNIRIIKYQKLNNTLILQGFKFLHNIILEIIWTIIPIIIIIEIIFPSLALIADEEMELEKSYITLNIIGNQWYWEYELKDANFLKSISSNLINSQYRSLVTNNFLKLPIGMKICLFITSNDVNHSWALPSLGIKVDAIPNRINFKNFKSNLISTHIGMCSELCGVEHGFMPINIQIVSKHIYNINNNNNFFFGINNMNNFIKIGFSTSIKD